MSYDAFVEGNRLAIVGQGLSAIPVELGREHGAQIERLDLSGNAITVVSHLESLSSLKSLILDRNQLSAFQQFPRLGSLESLSVRDNQIAHLEVFLGAVLQSYPNLTEINLSGNPCAPNAVDLNGSQADREAYEQYQKEVRTRFAHLKRLDGIPVSSASTHALFDAADPDSPFLHQHTPSDHSSPQAQTQSSTETVATEPADKSPPSSSSSPEPQPPPSAPSPEPQPNNSAAQAKAYPVPPSSPAPAAKQKQSQPTPAAPTTPSNSLFVFRASKKGGTVKNWKIRHWVFDPSSGSLTYYEDKELKHKKGHVELNQVTGIGPVRHDRIANTLGLRTKDRLWVLGFESADEMGRVQTELSSVVHGLLAPQDVPVSALGKLKRGLDGITKKGAKPAGNQPATSNSSQSNSGSSTSSSSTTTTTSSSSDSSSKIEISTLSDEQPTPSNNPRHSTLGGVQSEAALNEKGAVPKLNHHLSRIREYVGKEFTLECDMAIVRACLERDYPDKKDQPGDIIYAGFMDAFANKIQEICEFPLYRDQINHKCNGRIIIRISDDGKDKVGPRPYTKLEGGAIVIVCHRSLLTSSLVDLGEDLLDVLSIDEPLHICTVKDIEDFKSAIKNCLVRIQSALLVTYQYECDYTENYNILKQYNPTAAAKYRVSWGEAIFAIVEQVTAFIVKMASEPGAKEDILSSTPHRVLKIKLVPTDAAQRSGWLAVDDGNLGIMLAADKFAPEQPLQL